MNLAGTKFMLLMPQEAMTCKMNVLKGCPSRSPTYKTKGYRMCVMGLFRGHERMVQEICQVDVMTEEMLPQPVCVYKRGYGLLCQIRIVN